MLSLLLSGGVVGRELRIHLVERAAGNAKRGKHLLAGGFALAPFFPVAPFNAATQHCCQYDDRRKTLPEDGVAVQPLRAAPASLVHQLALKARRGGAALE